VNITALFPCAFNLPLLSHQNYSTKLKYHKIYHNRPSRAEILKVFQEKILNYEENSDFRCPTLTANISATAWQIFKKFGWKGSVEGASLHKPYPSWVRKSPKTHPVPRHICSNQMYGTTPPPGFSVCGGEFY